MIAWLIGVGLVVAGLVVFYGVGEVVEIVTGRERRHRPGYVLDPASITEADARLRNELARHHDGVTR